jgi:hypothetical protein
MFEVEVPDDATDEEIEKQIFEAALEEASFGFWVEEDQAANT